MKGETNAAATFDKSLSFIDVRNGTKTTLNTNEFDTTLFGNRNSGAQYLFANTALVSVDLDFSNLTGNLAAISMMQGCSSLTDVALDLSTLSGTYSAQSLFKDCTSLTTVLLNFKGFANLRNQATSLLQGCTSLKNISLDFRNMSGTQVVQNLLYGCSNLESAIIDIRSCVGSECCSNMFYNCVKLNSLTINMAAYYTTDSSCSAWLNGCILLNNIILQGVSNTSAWSSTSNTVNPLAYPTLSSCQNLTITCDILPNINLSVMTSLNLVSVVQVLGQLHDYTGLTAHTITFNRAFTGLSQSDYDLIDAAKTTAEARNWTVNGLTYSL